MKNRKEKIRKIYYEILNRGFNQSRANMAFTEEQKRENEETINQLDALFEEEMIRKVEKIVDKKTAKKTADMNESWTGVRACRFCAQDPEEWINKLLSELREKVR